jgi:hypothetical protein
MSLFKYLLLLSLTLSLVSCNDDDDSTSVADGDTMTCEMLLEEMEVSSFDEIDLDNFAASCSSGVISISATEDSQETRTFSCSGTDVVASSASGAITVDFSGVTVSEDRETVSGNISLSSDFSVSLSPDGSVASTVDCSFSLSGSVDDDDDEDPTLTGVPSCSVNGTDLDLTELPDIGDDCEATGDDSAVLMFFALFNDLSTEVLPQ